MKRKAGNPAVSFMGRSVAFRHRLATVVALSASWFIQKARDLLINKHALCYKLKIHLIIERVNFFRA